MKPRLRRVFVFLLGFAAILPCPGESFLLVGEESVDGILQTGPLASVEGIMSVVFDSGQIIFDTGALTVAVDWDGGNFDEPLSLAVEGRAGYIMAARVDSRMIAESEEFRSFSSRARYYLLDADAGVLAGRGELELSNLGRELDMPYPELTYRLGEAVGRELLRIWAEGMDKERKINKS